MSYPQALPRDNKETHLFLTVSLPVNRGELLAAVGKACHLALPLTNIDNHKSLNRTSDMQHSIVGIFLGHLKLRAVDSVAYMKFGRINDSCAGVPQTCPRAFGSEFAYT